MAGIERGGCYGEATWFEDAGDVDVEPLAWEELRGRQTLNTAGLEVIEAQGAKYCIKSVTQ
jgi:hypothetical protein